jgi:hypothetical protein
MNNSVSHDQNCIGLDFCPARQRCDAQCGPSRIWRIEKAFHGFIDETEVLEISQVDGNLDRVVERCSRGMCDSLQIIEDLLYLLVDAALDHFAGVGIQRNLSRYVYRRSGLYRLRVCANRRWCICRGYCFLGHVSTPVIRDCVEGVSAGKINAGRGMSGASPGDFLHDRHSAHCTDNPREMRPVFDQYQERKISTVFMPLIN